MLVTAEKRLWTGLSQEIITCSFKNNTWKLHTLSSENTKYNC